MTQSTLELLRQIIVSLTALVALLSGPQDVKFGATSSTTIILESNGALDPTTMKFVLASQMSAKTRVIPATATSSEQIILPPFPDDDNNGIISIAEFVDARGNRVRQQIPDLQYQKMGRYPGTEFNPIYKY